MLEGRVAATESLASAGQRTTDAKKMSKLALQHMRAERQIFKAEDIRKAEELYIRASALVREGGNSEALLDSVVSLYPKLNRAGCARLYRAQMATGDEKIAFLNDCINRFGTCFYGDGAQVGPLAIFELANYYQLIGEGHNAQKLFKQLSKEYPEAIDHNGVLLTDRL